MPVLQVGRASTGGHEHPLRSPYEKDEEDLIHPGEDFTILLTHISQSLLHNYRGRMAAGSYGNDHFVVMSQFGIGSHGGQLPSKTLHHVERIDSITSDIHSFWGETIRWIEDYRDIGTDGNAGRIFIAVSAFCQNLGDDSQGHAIAQVARQVVGIVGRFAPSLASTVTTARGVLHGVGNIARKLLEKEQEVKTSTITLYPGTAGDLLPGDAYLQRGSYVLFFEETEISRYRLTSHGRVEPVAGATGEDPPAYVVVNIRPFVVDGASSAMLDKAVALDILEKHDDRYALPGASREREGGNGSVFEGLARLGGAYRFRSRLERYRELARKERSAGGLPPAERNRLVRLRAGLEEFFDDTLRLG